MNMFFLFSSSALPPERGRGLGGAGAGGGNALEENKKNMFIIRTAM